MSVFEPTLLYHISHRLNSDLDINRVLADVLDLTVHRVGANNGSIMIFDEEGTVAHKILARAGMPSEKAQDVIAEVLSQGLAGWVVEQRRGDVIYDVLADDRWVHFADDDLVGGSAVSVPLVRRDRTVGVLTLRHPQKGHFTNDHLDLLSSIADQAAIAIENARLFHSVQAERARMRAILNDAGEAIIVTDRQGRILLINAVARRAFDIPVASDLTRRHLTALIQNQALRALWEHREQATYPSKREIPLPGKRTLHASLTRVPNVGFVFVMQDITELKEMDQMRSEFVSAVSHDLRSPLQLIDTYASLIPDSGLVTDRQHDLLDGIHRGVRRMAILIENLLDLAKIEAGVDMDRQPCRLDQIIDRVIERCAEMAQEKGLILQSQVPPDLPSVEANAGRLDQVLSNLVENAIKYTLEGTVTVQALADEQQVTIHVIDTGIGLTPQEQQRLFNKFYRARNDLTANIDGTGLGLAIVKSIVEQYDGKIWVRSAGHGGSTFSFSIPRDGHEPHN